MSTDRQNPARPALEEALDPELVARLRRPLAKPGIIAPVIARRITDMVDYFSNRVPLMEEILQRRNVRGALRHDDMPVVHAERPREPAAPEPPAVVASGEAPKERVIVKPTERIVERAAPTAIDRVIDRAAPPAAGIVEGRSETTIKTVVVTAPAPALALTPGIQANPTGVATPVIQSNPAVVATPVIQSNPAAAVTPVMEANTAGAATPVVQANPAAGAPVVTTASPAVEREPRLVAASDNEAAAAPRAVTSPEVRAPSQAPLTQVAPAAARMNDGPAATAARPEIDYGPDGTPQIHSLRRAAAEALAERSKGAAERGGEQPAASKATRMPAFTVRPRPQRPGEGPRGREVGLVPVSPAQSADASSPPSPAGPGIQRPAAIDAPLFSDKPAAVPAREIAEPVARPRADASPADMPPAIEVIARPTRRKEPSATSNTGGARPANTGELPTGAPRLPVIQPARRANPRPDQAPLFAEAPKPLARVRPSSPAWSPSAIAETPPRAPEERPRVKPERVSTPAGEAAQELLPKRGASPVSPLPKVSPSRAAAPIARAPVAGDPLPPAASEVSTARIGQFVAAQVEGLPGAAPASIMDAAAPRTFASPPAPPADPAAAPSSTAPQPPSAARRESALSSIDMNALAAQVQRKILRNLAVERARKGGIR